MFVTGTATAFIPAEIVARAGMANSFVSLRVRSTGRSTTGAVGTLIVMKPARPAEDSDAELTPVGTSRVNLAESMSSNGVLLPETPDELIAFSITWPAARPET